MFYQVKDQQFSNKFLAASYASKNNADLHFNLYESAFDLADWGQEPTASWNQLLDLRAQQIAAKGKPIVLYFSGGTDSYTIYKVFERNNIHIDVAYIREWPTEVRQQTPVLELMLKNWYDPHTKMIVREGADVIKNHSYLDPGWIWEKGFRYQYGFIGTDEQSNDEIADMLGTSDFIAVLGFEKPRLHFDSTGVYSYQDDENYVRTMRDPRMDCFYISPDLPELHIKQSYMLLNYVKRLRPYATSTDSLTMYNNIHAPAKFPWYRYSFDGCGRIGDLNESDRAHVANAGTKLILPEDGKFNSIEYYGRARALFDSYRKEATFKNYVDGIMSVASDPAGKFLMQDPTNFYSMRQFRSKGYKLNFSSP